ncbi:MAG: DEAD/DEAH box helicase [Spirochaetota bacterium]|nr:MAG: DEAD/DEAH box helicase [Spirochaetota bacterium]
MSFNEELLNRYFTQIAISKIKSEIHAASRNEVLFYGWTDENNLVEEVEVVARGNEVSVAVPMTESFMPDVIIHNHPEGPITPSDQDVHISSLIAQRGVGFFIIDNDVTQLYVVIEPVTKIKRRPLDADKLTALLSAGETLSEILPNFEERDGQLEMIRAVSDSYNQDTIALIEAGTGIGKSIAYLLPSIAWSVENRGRVIISTKTINLQEQLLYKDIPDLETLFKGEFTYILMKGRGNYVCMNRVAEAKQDLFTLIDDEEGEQFQAIFDWIDKTEDGSLSDLTFVPETSLWEKINSQTETCLGGACQFFNRCFINRVKRRAVTSNIVVTNHHYLLADASLGSTGNSILPSFDRVIFDEAHNLEDSATSFFTRRITRSRLLRLLNRLYTGGRNKRGYIVYLQKRKVAVQDEKLEEIQKAVSGLKRAVSDMFETIKEFTITLNFPFRKDSQTVIELTGEVIDHPKWESVVLKSVGIFYKDCTSLVSKLFELKTSLDQAGEERYGKQIEGFISRLVETVETLDIFLKDDTVEWVRWIEDKNEIAIVLAPINVGSTINELIFKRVKSAILTSATLTVDGSFDFLKGRLHLDDVGIMVRIDSPFQWDKQMRMFIPTDLVEPDHPDYNQILSEHILNILLKSGGKAFVLFTSYRVMDDVFNSIKDQLLAEGIISFKQGDDSRKNLLERFKYDIRSTLFGTESFWEGVDAPGPTLQCVIITKLPFKVPTEPIIKARLKQIEASGKNPFLEYSLPIAVIKLRQGIGRLIRNTRDRGIVAILDIRILRKSYGSVFLGSIPGGNPVQDNLNKILDELALFLSNTP